MYLKKIFIFSIILICFIYIFMFSSAVFTSIHTTMNLWLTCVFPSLFPIFVLISLAIDLEIIHFVNKLFYPFLKLLFRNLERNSSFIIIISLISGNPSSSKMITDALDNNLITIKTANKLICFTSFANPMFIIGLIYNSFYLNFSILIIILISHYIPNILIGIVIMFKKDISNNEVTNKKNKSNSIPNIFIEAIDKNFNIMLMICSTMICFNLFSNMMSTLNIFKNIFCFSNYTSELINLLVIGLIELVNGINNVYEMSLSIKTSLCLISFFLGFGGLCIHTQIYSIINNYDISMKNFIICRFIHGILSVIIVLIIFPVIFNDILETAILKITIKKTNTYLLINITIFFIIYILMEILYLYKKIRK